MRIFFTLLLLLLVSTVFSQQIDSLFIKLPDSLRASIKYEKRSIRNFPRDFEAVVTFNYADVSVRYFVFPYEAADSVQLMNAVEKYWMASDCYIDFVKDVQKDFDKSFKIFIKDNYFFLLELCYCRTGRNEKCAELAKRINQWSRKKN